MPDQAKEDKLSYSAAKQGRHSDSPAYERETHIECLYLESDVLGSEREGESHSPVIPHTR